MKFLYRHIFHIKVIPFALVFLVAIASCHEELPDVSSPVGSNDGLVVTGTINIPDMQVSMTRGQMGETPKPNLKLTVLEFDKGVNASNSFLSNIYQAELNTTSGVVNGGTVEFKFTVKASTTPKTLHLMIADSYLNPPYGSEATILPALTVGTTQQSSNPEAYWGRVEFADGLTTVDVDGNPVIRDDVRPKLSNVPVIRNFARINVTETAPNFELLGFQLVNVPTSGTVAPWNQSSLSIPDLLNGNSMQSYAGITDIIKYGGVQPSGVQFINTEADAKSSWVDGPNSSLRSTADRYLYEHPYESTRRTYLIVNGNYYASATASWQQGFYKVDIGKMNNETGTFDYYNIIRNIQYNVVITEVSAPGTATVAEAIDRAPFNNLMAATETASMLNVSDGKNMLIVNDTNHIIVNKTDTVDVLFRYIEGVTGSKTQNDSIPKAIGLKVGPVIESWEGPTTYTDPNTNVKWIKYRIVPNTPTADVKTQDFSIVDGAGLGRTIHLVLRTPWQYAKLSAASDSTATVRTGVNNSYSSATPETISSKAGENFTVYFNLPDGLPETMFPLEFQLEAKYQGIENNKVGTLVVNSGPSLFDPSRIAISYIKTVTYNEYLYWYTNDTSDVIDVNKKNTNHTVRCRFTTITVQSNPATNKAQILIHNPYFQPNASVGFIRQ